MAPADPSNRCRRRQTVAIRSAIERQSAICPVSKGATGAPPYCRIGKRSYLRAQGFDNTDTLKRAAKDSPGATASGEWRRASAAAVIGSKQTMSALAGAKICA